MVKKIALGLLAVLVVIQFFQIDKSKQEIDSSKDFFTVVEAPAAVKSLVEASCYDCHSNTTEYPWYSYIQPVGWWLKNHVEDGKGHLNFSEWTSYEPRKAKHKLEECFEEVESGEMPFKAYTLTHPEARLDEAQRTELVNWFKTQHEGM